MINNWKVILVVNGFKVPLLIEGSELEMRAYLDSEIGRDMVAGIGSVQSYRY